MLLRVSKGVCPEGVLSLGFYSTLCERGVMARFTKKNLRKNPKFSITFSEVYLKLILSCKVKIFIDFYKLFNKAVLTE